MTDVSFCQYYIVVFEESLKLIILIYGYLYHFYRWFTFPIDRKLILNLMILIT